MKELGGPVSFLEGAGWEVSDPRPFLKSELTDKIATT